MCSIYDQFNASFMRPLYQVHVGGDVSDTSDTVELAAVSKVTSVPQPAEEVSAGAPSIEEPVAASVEETATTESVTEAPTTIEEQPADEAVDPAKLKKAELVSYIKSRFGEDSDVTGTKQDLLDRFFA